MTAFNPCLGSNTITAAGQTTAAKQSRPPSQTRARRQCRQAADDIIEYGQLPELADLRHGQTFVFKGPACEAVDTYCDQHISEVTQCSISHARAMLGTWTA